jgi:Zn-dependent protease
VEPAHDRRVEQSFRIGRIAGIEIGAHWSLGVIFWLVTWSLADSALPEAAPGHAPGAYWVAAAAGGVTFFGCLLAHELAHALVARRAGMPVEGITLWLFGGVSRLAGEPPDARTELRVSAVGPATSLGLSAGLGIVAWATSPLGDLLSSTIAWLAAVNLVLGIFNLVPAFPLDGGRILQAVLWHRHGDLRRATRTAVAAGRSFGYLLIGVGLLGATAGGGISSVWLSFVGWFLLLAARAEGSGVTVRSLLTGVRVREVMTPDPVTVPADLSVEDLLHQFVLRSRHSAYPVLGAGGALLGLVTLEGIRRIPAPHRAGTLVRAITVPTGEVPALAPDDLLLDALAQIGEAAGGRALVVDGDAVVGILCASDVQRALQVFELASPPAR